MVEDSISAHKLKRYVSCPDDEYYFFSWSIHATRNRAQSRLLLGQDRVKNGPYTTISPRGGDSGTSSTQAIVKCVENRVISVQVTIPPSDGPITSILGSCTLFTGFRIEY